MSDASNDNEMDAPATKRDLYELRTELRTALQTEFRAELRTALERHSADLIHLMRSLNEDLFTRVKALFDPYNDLPRRMTDAEARLDALEQRPAPRRARRRS